MIISNFAHTVKIVYFKLLTATGVCKENRFTVNKIKKVVRFNYML